MQTKLTLRLDDQLIEKAKHWAALHNISLSEVVADFFRQLPDPEQSLKLSPWTQTLVGVLKPASDSAESTEALREAYLDYLEQKYK